MYFTSCFHTEPSNWTHNTHRTIKLHAQHTQNHQIARTTHTEPSNCTHNTHRTIKLDAQYTQNHQIARTTHTEPSNCTHNTSSISPPSRSVWHCLCSAFRLSTRQLRWALSPHSSQPWTRSRRLIRSPFNWYCLVTHWLTVRHESKHANGEGHIKHTLTLMRQEDHENVLIP
jgi:hypothetical protein